MVTIGLLFSLTDGRFRALYRWWHANYRRWFPTLPDRTRLQRRLRDHAADGLPFLASPTCFTVVAKYGIEVIHPRREGRRPQPIGKQGKANGRSLVGVKRAWLIHAAGEGVDGTWATANEPDTVVRPLASGYAGE